MAQNSRQNHVDNSVESLSLTVSADEARAIDSWSAAHHIDDRSEAVHRLVNLALDADFAADDAHLR
jgi:hypothetical protein